MSRFSITNHKGVNITFENGWQVSVQWGPGNYCERKEDDYDSPENSEYWSSNSAEIAVWSKEGPHNRKYEEQEQDKRRKIRLLDPSFVEQFIDEYQKLIGETAI